MDTNFYLKKLNKYLKKTDKNGNNEIYNQKINQYWKTVQSGGVLTDDQLEDLQKQVDQVIKENETNTDKLNNIIEGSISKFKELRGKLDAVNKELITANNIIEENKKLISLLEEDMENYQTNTENLEKQLKEVKDKLEEEKEKAAGETNEKISNLEEEKKELEKQLEELKNKEDKADKQIDILHKYVTNLLKQLEEINNNDNKISDQLEGLLDEQ